MLLPMSFHLVSEDSERFDPIGSQNSQNSQNSDHYKQAPVRRSTTPDALSVTQAADAQPRWSKTPPFSLLVCLCNTVVGSLGGGSHLPSCYSASRGPDVVRITINPYTVPHNTRVGSITMRWLQTRYVPLGGSEPKLVKHSGPPR